MTRNILLFVILLVGTILAGAQSRMGDVPVPELDVVRAVKAAEEADSAAARETTYMRLVGEAEKALADEDYTLAERRIVDAMAHEPHNPTNILLLSNLGMVYAYQDRDTMALAAYDEALRRAPAMTTVRHNRAMLHLKMGNDKAAYDDFADIIARDSLNTPARYYHGIMALYSGNLPTAESDFAVMRDNDPDGYNTQAAMAALCSLTRRDREAIPYYKKLIELDPSPEYYAALAGCYLATNNQSDAAEILADAMKRFPSDPELYYYSAWLARDRYQLDSARALAKRAIELGADPGRVKELFKKK